MEDADWTAVIIEDDPDVRDLIDLVLSQSGFRTVLAEDGLEGVDAVRRHNPLITTLDVNMPGMDGIALALRVAKDNPNILIVLMTGYATEKQRAHNLNVLIHRVISKPFTLKEICAVVNDALAVSDE